MNPNIKSILIDNLSSDWKIFAYGTELNLHIIEYIDLNEGSNEFKMEYFLRELISRNANNYINLIEKSLRELGKEDILYEIQACYASYQLKQHYIKKHGSVHQPISQHDEENNVDFSTNHFDFNAVNNSYYINFEENFNEWEDFNKKRNLHRVVTFKEVLTEELPLLLISGIRGVGKTYLLKKCLIYWAKELIWKNTDFVFYLDLQKIVAEFENISCVNKLIKKFYGNVLKGFEISSQSSFTLIIDGLDKFIYFKKLIRHNLGNSRDIPLINTLENVLSSAEINCVLAGRVQAIAAYWNTLKNNNNAVNVQIMGLSNLGIKFYIENILQSFTLKNDLYEFVSYSLDEKLIMCVPYYLKAICLTLLNTTIVSVKTVTELQALIFYYLMQKSNLLKSKPLHQLNDKKWQILKICKLAFTLLENKRTFIYKDELDFFRKKFDTEPNVFIEMSNINQKYEFTHPFILNFCASVYLYYCKTPQFALNNKILHVCLPIASALSYGSERNIFSLICNFKKPIYKEKSWIQDIYDYNDPKIFVQCLHESQTTLNDFKFCFDLLNKWNILLNEDSGKARKYFNQKMEQLNYFVKLKVIINKAKIIYKDTDYNKAKKLFQDLEKIQDLHFGYKHQNTTITEYINAQGLYNKECYDDDLKLFEEVEITRKEILGEKHADTIYNKYMIAMSFYDKKCYDGAKTLFEEVENLRKEVLGEKHADTISTKNMIAKCLYCKKCYDGAKTLFEEVENLGKEVLGKKHKDTISAKNMIANCLYGKKFYDAAKTLFEEVENLRKEVLGEKHSDTVTTKNMIANCLYETKYYDDAKTLFEEVENLRKEVFGEKYKDYKFSAMDMIAMCLNETKML